MIEKVNTGISSNTNKRIIDLLFEVNTWSFGFEIFLSKNINKSIAGMLYRSYMDESTYVGNDALNSYAFTICDMVEKNSYLNFKKIKRVYWNWYFPGSSMEFHHDDPKDNSYSIVYNLHNNDGGTDFKINNEVTFHKSIESEAILFPSKIYHRGIAPKKSLNRFSLNMMVEI